MERHELGSATDNDSSCETTIHLAQLATKRFRLTLRASGAMELATHMFYRTALPIQPFTTNSEQVGIEASHKAMKYSQPFFRVWSALYCVPGRVLRSRD